MEYRGLTADDLANINALNRSFLAAIAGSGQGAFSDVTAHPMTRNERARLASAPFLLFSLREGDENYWQQMLEENPQINLIDSSDRPDRAVRQLQVAGLSFLWQLARRNPYVVRLVCGASVAWCERLSALTLVELLQQTGQRHDLLCLRFAGDSAVWRRLLDNGTVASRIGRRASHHGVFHMMLTRRYAHQSKRLSAAACAMRAPSQHSTRQSNGGIRDLKV